MTDNPEKVNRRGCALLVAALLLVLLAVAFLATNSMDRQQSNEAVNSTAT
jgi:type II secretory pathway component PulK